MIITKLIGGIGNQMFQYTVARRLAYIHNTELKLDITSYRNYHLRSYHLNPFNIIEKIACDEEINRWRNLYYVGEPHFHFYPGILNLGPEAYLEGYWQSEKYFKDIEGVIRSDFTVREPPRGLNAVLVNQILSSQAVAVHIRRGDYVTNAATHNFHGTCSLGYYYHAIGIIASRVPHPHLFIFSDEPDWVRQNMNFNFPITFVSNNANWPVEDLRLMSFCKYHVIANSTFSWWGAWLANHVDKIVIAPQRWFNNQVHHIGDLFPDNWLLI